MPSRQPKKRQRDYAAEYAARKARAKRKGSTVYQQRQARARAMGWESYSQQRAWRPQLTDAYIRELGEKIGGPVEAEREGSLLSREANAIVNPRGEVRRPGDWRIRLLIAAGRITE
jgi:hypothetical protein